MWKVSYFDFDQSISKVLEQDPTFINFDPLTDIYKRDDFEKCFFNKKLIFLDLNFVLNKAHYASCNTKFWRNILNIAQKCEEHHEMSIDFIDELRQIIFLDKEEELGENERKF